jgi:hypothetical protein
MSKVKTLSIIPAATEAVIQPKPTRTEIVEALTRLKIEEVEAANIIKADAIGAQKLLVQNLALTELSASLAKASPFTAEKGDVRANGYSSSSSYVEFSVRVTSDPKQDGYGNNTTIKASKELIAEFAKLEKLPSAEWVREDEIRKGIKDSLSRDSAGRVSRLLSDVESRAALSELLKVVEAGGEKRLNSPKSRG